MQNFLKPKWIFSINSLPILVLFFIFYSKYSIINSLLKEESITLWKYFGGALVGVGVVNLLYGVYLLIKKQQVSVFYGFTALIVYVTLLYFFGMHVDDLIPSTIPRWMRTDNIEIYPGTFLMPTLIYSLFVLIVRFTSKEKEYKAWKSALVAISIPLICYLFFQIVLPLWKPYRSGFNQHVFLVFLIVSVTVFLFFLTRSLYILISKKGNLQKYQLAWKIPITIIFPILGLLINNGFLFKETYIDNAFGDFNNHWFYILAVLNGLFLCLPNIEHKLYRLGLLIARSITFAYTFYFFMVFLPFLPLSVIAIIAFGAGFLLLAPIVLFVIHINEFSKDLTYFAKQKLAKVAWILSIIGFLVIPTLLHFTYLKDKETLNETLEYLYSPNYEKTYAIDKDGLQKVLNVISSHKKNRSFLEIKNQPFLSSYYNWVVLDNLTLSDKKINTIKHIFFGKKNYGHHSENITNENVKITNISSRSTYDENEQIWKSWVDLEISNLIDSRFSEYATTIQLPEGTWISDYYLYVGDRKEMGILAEKKSAMWVFSNIRNENKDPGILYYLTGNKVAFKVFPFDKKEVRKTGIEFLHKAPIQLNFDGNVVQLGKERERTGIYENQYVVYIPAYEKAALEEVQRTPYVHFILDATNKGNISNYSRRIDKFIEEYPELRENAKISFVDAYVTSTSFSNWEEAFKNQAFEGGFYIDRAIKTTLFNAYKKNSNSYPIIVIVTDNIYKTTLEKDYADWEFTFPESPLFYNLGEEGNLVSHSLFSEPRKRLNYSEKIQYKSVLKFTQNDRVYYLSKNQKSSVVLKNDFFEINNSEIREKSWDTGLLMQGSWKSSVLYPANNKKWLQQVRNSFISKIMTPVTSYIVVENEAQKAILKKKQKEVLTGNKSLDLDEETTTRMSEPSIYFLILLFLVFLWYKKRRKFSCKVSKTL